MPDPDEQITLKLHARIADIPAADWDACAGDANVFVSHAFLAALEDSGSVGPGTGWTPRYAVFRDEAQRIAAVTPSYLKSHSYGEYVFDQSWAEAFAQAGGHYYPKLQICSPFSPVTGPRLLCHPENNLSLAAIGNALMQITDQSDLSSAHITFCTEEEARELTQSGWLSRLGVQFHWQNQGYKSFDDFLDALKASHRKTIRRERRDANNAGLVFEILRGDDIKPRHWDAFYQFYQDTIDRKWGSAYLTRDFFTLLSENLGNQVVLMLASHNSTPVAGALNLVGGDVLYGRNWGCRGQFPFLHFELCYYRAIDFAIQNGLKRVEAGAQGAHKIQRGYLPKFTYSAHYIRHQGFADAVGRFLAEERKAVTHDAENLAGFSPFRRENA